MSHLTFTTLYTYSQLFGGVEGVKIEYLCQLLNTVGLKLYVEHRKYICDIVTSLESLVDRNEPTLLDHTLVIRRLIKTHKNNDNKVCDLDGIEICRNYYRRRCRGNCKFSHEPPAPDCPGLAALRNTPCTNLMETGHCEHGDTCCFLHDVADTTTQVEQVEVDTSQVNSHVVDDTARSGESATATRRYALTGRTSGYVEASESVTSIDLSLF